MKSIARTLLLATGLLATPAAAQQAACALPPDSGYQGIRFFLGIEPSDGILDVWCRIQTVMRGKGRLRIEFPGVGAGKTAELDFTGSPSMPRERLANYIQSLLPSSAKDAARDKDDQPFPAVLDSVVQASASKTPDGQLLGLPRPWGLSKSLALWQPVTLRVRPLYIGGKEFALSVTFKPSPGRFLMAMQGQAEQFLLKVPNERALRYKGLLDGDECSALIPLCKDLGGMLDVHTPWLVDQVQLVAEGGNLSGATQALFPSIAAANPTFVEYNSMRRFSVPFGEAEVNVRDAAREIEALAVGDDAKIGGTTRISVVWKERPNTKGTYATSLWEWTQKTRSALLLQYGTR